MDPWLQIRAAQGPWALGFDMRTQGPWALDMRVPWSYLSLGVYMFVTKSTTPVGDKI